MATKYSVTKEIFSKRLKELMVDNNETTYSMGEMLNLSAATISRYTDGKMAPKITTIYSMSTYFNVNPVWLMGYDVEKNLKVQNTTINLSEKEKILLENFNKLNDLGKKEATKRVSELTEINKYIKLPNNKKETWKEEKEHLMPVAAHAKENATTEDIQHDLDMMNDENW